MIVPALPIAYYSDILCIWAYVAQPRVDELYREHGTDISLEYRFMPVFGDTGGKIHAAWKDRGGFEGYAAHVKGVADRFPDVRLSPLAWAKTRPASSMSPHLFIKAVMLWERQRVGGPRLPLTESVIWALRRGFFAEGQDIAQRDVQHALAAPFGVDANAVEQFLSSGEAHAALSADYLHAEKSRIEGSPTFVLNDGRQKIYGNVGFRVIDANIRELLREPSAGEASWC